LRPGQDPVSSGGHLKESDMRWEIPRATEVRFGMEITLNIARR
jgi:coenzyme PQQ precursor peptide PqqA